MRNRLIAVALVALALGAVLYAQEAERFNGRPILVERGYAELGAGVRFTMEGTTADAFEFTFRMDPTADTNYIWPATVGSAGTQLQTDGVAGATQLSWASAASTRDAKVLDGVLPPEDALTAVLAAPVHRFHYKPGAGTLDTQTQYAGIVADEAPWAMHHDGQILNPINTAGYAFAAIQAQQAQIDALKAEIAALRGR